MRAGGTGAGQWGGPPGLPSGIRVIKPKKADQEVRPTTDALRIFERGHGFSRALIQCIYFS